MRTLLQLAALVLAAATAHAQIVTPDKLVAPAPRNPALARPSTATDYQWLWQYARPSNKPGLLTDERFTSLLQQNLKAPQAMWGRGIPLHEAAATFLAGKGAVSSTDNRHIIVTGCVIDHCPQRGLLYADLGERDPLIVFAALRWNEQARSSDEPHAPFTLWVFPSRAIDAHQLPPALKQSLSTFAGAGVCNAPNITSTIVVDPDGIPHVLGSLETGIQPALCTTNPGPTL